MTVSTVVAGLLPIMWSTRVGADVMKPLATPVLGGMVSSLLHVLIVTPVLFYWIHERRLGLQHESLRGDRRSVPVDAGGHRRGRRALLRGDARVARRTRDRPGRLARDGRVVQTVRAGDLDIVCCTDPARSVRAATLSRSSSVARTETAGRCGSRPRQRQHGDARHGDVERPPGRPVASRVLCGDG